LNEKKTPKKINNVPSKPLTLSLTLHIALLILFVIFALVQIKLPTRVDFEVYENPIPVSAQVITLNKPAPPKPVEALKPKAVFGVSRNAILDQSQTADTATVKQGNTVAKEQDNEKLNPNDPDQLPIPSEDYLVTSMPQVLNEYKIPYPPEAKKRKIQGPVVMELLIDQTGSVRQALLLEGPGFGLNEAALEAIKNFKFKPGMIQDQPVAVKIRYSYRFILE
jgi:protein TonB